MRTFLFLALLVATGLLYGQADSSRTERKIKFGISANYNATPEIIEAFSPGIEIIRKKHSVIIGPRIWFWKPDPPDIWKKYGAGVTYRFTPNDHDARFQLYFLYDLRFSREELTEELYPDHFGLGRYMHSETTLTLTNNFGYGFRIQLFKGLYLNKSVGFGFQHYRLDYCYYLEDDPSIPRYYQKGKLGEIDISLLFNAGIGYGF